MLHSPSGTVPKKTGFLESMPSMSALGKKETYMGEKAVEALKPLPGNLNSSWDENFMAEDPTALRSSVELTPRQKCALDWLLWRESNNPYGGILGDDEEFWMPVVSTILKSRNYIDDDGEDMKAGTLVVCEGRHLDKWRRMCAGQFLDAQVYHGIRERVPERLTQHDVVITSYNTLRIDKETSKYRKAKMRKRKFAKKGPLHTLKWKRIILDNVNNIQTTSSKSATAAFKLKSVHRWVILATTDPCKMYPIIKFLMWSPYDDFEVWQQMTNDEEGMQHLKRVINSLMLVSTQDQLAGSLAFTSMSPKSLQSSSKSFGVFKVDKILPPAVASLENLSPGKEENSPVLGQGIWKRRKRKRRPAHADDSARRNILRDNIQPSDRFVCIAEAKDILKDKF